MDGRHSRRHSGILRPHLPEQDAPVRLPLAQPQIRGIRHGQNLPRPGTVRAPLPALPGQRTGGGRPLLQRIPAAPHAAGHPAHDRRGRGHLENPGPGGGAPLRPALPLTPARLRISSRVAGEGIEVIIANGRRDNILTALALTALLLVSYIILLSRQLCRSL